MLQSLISLRAAPLPPPELTTAGGYWPAATSTSLSATARSLGTRLPTPGGIWQIWYRPAIYLQAQPQVNHSTPSRAALRPALVPTTTNSTPKLPAAHQLLLPRRRQH